jgi:hypothetical protein
MPVESILVLILAAPLGRLFHAAVVQAAERTGHSRAAAEEALATGGFSLVLKPRPQPNGDEAPSADAR